MQPINGIVVKLRERDVDILLKSGTVVQVIRERKFNLGSRVKVLYDFTQMKVKSVLLENEIFPDSELEDTGEEEQDDEALEYSVLLSYYDGLEN